jgi:hypothetical protein
MFKEGRFGIRDSGFGIRDSGFGIWDWSGGKAKKGESPIEVGSAFKIGYSNAT